jgi:alpha-tubulin suppressor-like RCC1 family protein
MSSLKRSGARIGSGVRRRRWAAALAVIGTALALAADAPVATSAEESNCPNTPGGTAVLDWGINGQEQLGAGFKSGKENSPRSVLGLSGVKELQAGFNFTLALKADCTLVAWGNNGRGQLGDGIPRAPQSHPVPVKTLTNVKEVANGKGAEAHVLALEYNGTAWTWGASEFGERGDGEKGFEPQAETAEPEIVKHRYEPTQVLLEPKVPLTGVKQVTESGVRDYALLTTGEVLGWGQNSNNELGVEPAAGVEKKCNGEPAPKLAVPCVVYPLHVKTTGAGGPENLTGVEKVVAGVSAAYAVRNGGIELLGWGSNKGGELMTAAETVTSAVKLWTAPSPIVEIAGGDGYALARLASGAIYAWGKNNHQQLGFESGKGAEECAGKAKCTRVPIQVASLTHVVKLSASRAITLALKREADGKKVIYAFGSNTFYELLGLGAAYEDSVDENGKRIIPDAGPTPITGLASISDVSVAGTTSSAVIENGAPPAPVLTAEPITEALQVTWGALAEGYKFRWKPVGVRKFSKLYERRCEKGQLCGRTERVPPVVEGQPLESLPPEPFEFFLNSGVVVTEHGKEIVRVARVRSIAATPLPPAGAPVNITPPTLPSSARVGQPEPLIASEGAWTNSPTSYSYEWLRCESFAEPGHEEEFGEECAPIEDEPGHPHEGNSYTPTERDLGHTLRVSVKASNARGWSKAASEAAKAVIVRGLAPDEASEVPGAPENTAAPKLTSPLAGHEGSEALQGQPLTLQPGTWEPEPLPALSHQRWFRCTAKTAEQEVAVSCHKIIDPQTGEQHEGTTYTTGAEDVGQWVEVNETAGNSGGYGGAISNAIFVEASGVPSNVEPPKVEGAEGKFFQVDQRLTANPGKWNGNPTSYAYVWERCKEAACKELKENEGLKTEKPATGSTYKVQTGDVGSTIRVKVTALNKNGASEPLFSSSSPEVPVPPRSPSPEAPPKISGAAQQGAELEVTPGRWHFESFSETGYEYPKEFKYQWFRCHFEVVNGKEKEICNAIKGTLEGSTEPVKAKYVPTKEDIGMLIKVKETVKIPNSEVKTESERVGPIVAAPPNSATPPTIEGFAIEGQTLMVRQGTWRGEPTSYTFQWNRCSGSTCEAISGATSQTYTLGEEDVGHSILVEERATNGAGTSAPASSSATAEVRPREPQTVSPPTIASPTDPPKQGQTLTESHAPWMPHPTSFAYEWKRCDAAGANCSAIAGATAQTYELRNEPGMEDVGHTIRVEETVFNASGYGTAESEPTKVVVPASPVVTRIEPAKGPAAGGTSVTITGENLDRTPTVEFGFVMASEVRVISSTSIVAVSPAGSGTVDVTVTTPYGKSATGPGDRFTYVPPPAVTGVEPSAGPEAGGTTVTVAGIGFEEVSAVKFGTAAATRVEVISANSLRATAPVGVGSVDITVATPNGTSAAGAPDRFMYVAPPTVTKLKPATGPAGGGTPVTITGTNLSTTSAVQFGSVAATGVRVNSATSVTATAPAQAAGTVDVTVTTAGGTSAAGTGDKFKYTPTITSVVPNTGSRLGGATVTVTGRGFAIGETGTKIKFGSLQGLKENCSSSTQCTVVSPPSATTGTVDVRATVNKEISPATTSDQFTYT